MKNELYDIFKELGFSEKETNEQLLKINDLISKTFYTKILKQYPELGRASDDNYKDFLNNLDNNLLDQYIEESVHEIVPGYLNAISQGLANEKKNNLYNSLAASYTPKM